MDLPAHGEVVATNTCLQGVIAFYLIGFQANFGIFLAIVYMLAMASTALAVMLGCSLEDPKVATEMLPVLYVPQILFAGFFVAPDLIPSWLSWARFLCSLTCEYFWVHHSVPIK